MPRPSVKRKLDKKGLQRRKAVNIAASLAASGVPFNNDTISDDVRTAAAQKLARAGKVSTMGRRRRPKTGYNP